MAASASTKTDEPVALEEVLVKRARPMRVRQQRGAQPARTQLGEDRHGVGVVLDVRRPRVEMMGRGFLEQCVGDVETDLP